MSRPTKSYTKQHVFLSDQTLNLLNECSDIIDAQGYSEVIKLALRRLSHRVLSKDILVPENPMIETSTKKIHVTLTPKAKQNLDFCSEYFREKSPSIIVRYAIMVLHDYLRSSRDGRIIMANNDFYSIWREVA